MDTLFFNNLLALCWCVQKESSKYSDAYIFVWGAFFGVLKKGQHFVSWRKQKFIEREKWHADLHIHSHTKHIIKTLNSLLKATRPKDFDLFLSWKHSSCVMGEVKEISSEFFNNIDRSFQIGGCFRSKSTKKDFFICTEKIFNISTTKKTEPKNSFSFALVAEKFKTLIIGWYDTRSLFHPLFLRQNLNMFSYHIQ